MKPFYCEEGLCVGTISNGNFFSVVVDEVKIFVVHCKTCGRLYDAKTKRPINTTSKQKVFFINKELVIK